MKRYVSETTRDLFQILVIIGGAILLGIAFTVTMPLIPKILIALIGGATLIFDAWCLIKS